jgi:dTDP-4-amino-4,6-dideoxygalactose transaminase
MIPFNRPTVAPGQLERISEAFSSGHLAGDGPFTKRAAAILSELHAGATVLLTTSCTAALEMSALLLDLEPGDEVILPSFTFVSSANAFALMGARIVFVDIDPDTLNLSVEQVDAAVTPRTRAVVAVNYGGVASVTDALLAVAAKHDLIVIEDNAHGLFGTADGHPLGTRAPLSTLSFHETKNVTCGEGGALVINDPRFVERAEIIREKGTNRSRFFRGMVDKYTWIDVGSSYLLSDVNAAILMAQLEHREAIQTRRRRTATRYRDALTAWADSRGYSMPHRDPDAGSPDHLFPLLMPDLDVRTRFLAHTRAGGVATTFHYIPLHSSPAGQRYGRAPFGAPNAVSVSERLIRLPLFSDIDDAEVDTVIDVTQEFEG